MVPNRFIVRERPCYDPPGYRPNQVASCFFSVTIPEELDSGSGSRIKAYTNARQAIKQPVIIASRIFQPREMPTLPRTAAEIKGKMRQATDTAAWFPHILSITSSLQCNKRRLTLYRPHIMLLPTGLPYIRSTDVQYTRSGVVTKLSRSKKRL